MDTAGRAPIPAVLPPAGAEAVLVLLKRAGIERYAGQMTPSARAAVEEFLRQLQLVTRWQQEWNAELTTGASVGGSTEVPVAEAAGVSPQEIDPEEAAVLLDITSSRVRQLCRAGELQARQVGRNWLVDRASVELRAMGGAA
jgi:excisionase family DNA binding protein